MDEQRQNIYFDPKEKMEMEGDFHFFFHKGLPCAVLRMEHSGNLNGYVGVPQGHKLYGVEYSQKVFFTDELKERQVNIETAPIIPIMCADGHGVSLEIAIEVHGGLTFSDGLLKDVDCYFTERDENGRCAAKKSIKVKMQILRKQNRPIELIKSVKFLFKNWWWFGFDTAHCNDLSPLYFRNGFIEHFNVMMKKMLPDMDGDEFENVFNRRMIYRDLQYVTDQTKHLAEQIADFKYQMFGKD